MLTSGLKNNWQVFDHFWPNKRLNSINSMKLISSFSFILSDLGLFVISILIGYLIGFNVDKVAPSVASLLK